MSIIVNWEAVEAQYLRPRDEVVLKALAEFGIHTGCCWLSAQQLAGLTRQSAASVERSIKLLRAELLLEVVIGLAPPPSRRFMSMKVLAPRLLLPGARPQIPAWLELRERPGFPVERAAPLAVA